jgi:hypothetical protein
MFSRFFTRLTLRQCRTCVHAALQDRRFDEISGMLESQPTTTLTLLTVAFRSERTEIRVELKLVQLIFSLMYGLLFLVDMSFVGDTSFVE